MQRGRHGFVLLLVAGLLLSASSGRAEASEPRLGPAPRLPDARPEAPSPLELLLEGPRLGTLRSVPWVDTSSRAAVVAFYEDYYLTAFDTHIGWTGSAGMCLAGSTSSGHRADTLQVVNFYRAMAGVPGDVARRPVLDAKCQQAALMMAANLDLSHDPPRSWQCYTEEGAQAASHGNLALGWQGPAAIDAYMADPGPGNTAVGHRRWILFPPQRTMGTGSVPATWANPPANALWVLDAGTWEVPAYEPPWVAWPPAGYVPYPFVIPRWSLSMLEADFRGAQVSMTREGVPVPLTVHAVEEDIGDPTLVWETASLGIGPGMPDTSFEVTVTGIRGPGASTVSYQVTAFDPTLVPEPGAGLAAVVAMLSLAGLQRFSGRAGSARS